jgi:hypothetical protein
MGLIPNSARRRFQIWLKIANLGIGDECGPSSRGDGRLWPSMTPPPHADGCEVPTAGRSLGTGVFFSR